MHRVVDCCFDSQKSPFTVLTEGRSPLKQISIPLGDINIPTLNMKDEMYSSGNSSNSNLQKKKEDCVDNDAFPITRKDMSAEKTRMHSLIDGSIHRQESSGPKVKVKDEVLSSGSSHNSNSMKELKSHYLNDCSDKILGSSSDSNSMKSSKGATPTARKQASRARLSEEQKQQIRERDRMRKQAARQAENKEQRSMRQQTDKEKKEMARTNYTEAQMDERHQADRQRKRNERVNYTEEQNDERRQIERERIESTRLNYTEEQNEQVHETAR